MNELNIHPVLVDIGASGTPPTVWQPLKPFSIYVGFDPDSRDIRSLDDSGFFAAWIVNKAIIAESDQETVRFYLTRSPYCSSTLLPITTSLENYLYADLFTVELQKDVPSTTLEAALQALNLDRIHWLKLDSQGMDLRLFKSLPDTLSGSVLALDVEPGLIDAYEGEDLFVQLHAELTKSGFWLADARVLGSVRVRKETVSRYPHLAEQLPRVKTAPGWVEARYLRSIESMRAGENESSDYVLLWLFAMQTGHYGFALDVLSEYARCFGEDAKSALMEQETAEALRRNSPHPLMKLAKSFVPRSVKQWAKAQLKRFRRTV